MPIVTLTYKQLAPYVEGHWKNSAYASSPQRSWDSWKDPHRETLRLAVSCTGAKSLYELGCATGPNLNLLREWCPSLRLGGCDIRQEYVDWALEKGFEVETSALPKKVSTEWEVALSCYTMAYVHAETVLAQLKAVEGQHLILMEPHGSGEVLQQGENSIPRWYHDWPKLFALSGWVMAWRWPIIPSADDLRAVVVARRG